MSEGDIGHVLAFFKCITVYISYRTGDADTQHIAARTKSSPTDTRHTGFQNDCSYLFPVSNPGSCRAPNIIHGIARHFSAAGNGQRTIPRKYPCQIIPIFTALAGSDHVPVIREQGNVLHGFLGCFLSFLCGLRGRRGFLGRRGRFLRGRSRFLRRRFSGGLRLHDGLGGDSGLLRSLGVRENRRHQLERHGDRHQQSQQFLHDATFFLYFRPVQLPPKQAAAPHSITLLSAYH